ncbi:hypothetical protein ACGC1H_003927 [Rhizoctonia solani]
MVCSWHGCSKPPQPTRSLQPTLPTMRCILFLLSLCFLVLAVPVRRDTDVLSLISALSDGLQNGQVSDITSTSQSLASLPTTIVAADNKSQIAIKAVTIITLSLDKNIDGNHLRDFIVNLEKCVPGVDKEIYRM